MNRICSLNINTPCRYVDRDIRDILGRNRCCNSVESILRGLKLADIQDIIIEAGHIMGTMKNMPANTAGDLCRLYARFASVIAHSCNIAYNVDIPFTIELVKATNNYRDGVAPVVNMHALMTGLCRALLSLADYVEHNGCTRTPGYITHISEASHFQSMCYDLLNDLSHALEVSQFDVSYIAPNRGIFPDDYYIL